MKIPDSLTDFSRIIFFDTETSGLEHETNRITEIAALCLEKDSSSSESDDFVILPDNIEMSENSVKITGITREFLKENGISESEAFEHFAEHYEGKKGRTLFIAHNAQFDLMFLIDAFERIGKTLPENFGVIDTLTVFRDRKDYSHKLSDAIGYYHIKDVENSHRAIDDVNALKEVFFAMAEQKDDLKNYVNLFGFNPNHKLSGYRLSEIRYCRQEFCNYRKSGRLYEIAELEENLKGVNNPHETAVRLLIQAKKEMRAKAEKEAEMKRK